MDYEFQSAIIAYEFSRDVYVLIVKILYKVDYH